VSDGADRKPKDGAGKSNRNVSNINKGKEKEAERRNVPNINSAKESGEKERRSKQPEDEDTKSKRPRKPVDNMSKRGSATIPIVAADSGADSLPFEEDEDTFSDEPTQDLSSNINIRLWEGPTTNIDDDDDDEDDDLLTGAQVGAALLVYRLTLTRNAGRAVNANEIPTRCASFRQADQTHSQKFCLGI